MDWFSEWFDSPYYHILYKNRDLNEAELFIDNLAKYLALPAGSEIIDIPCGKGRHCLYLNKKGFKVSGADLSPESITYAKQYSTPTLDFFTHDMRVHFAEEKYDAVLNIFTSFGYFDDPQDNQRCIDAFQNALKKNGTLVMDFINFEKILPQLQQKESKTIDGLPFILKNKSKIIDC